MLTICLTVYNLCHAFYHNNNHWYYRDALPIINLLLYHGESSHAGDHTINTNPSAKHNMLYCSSHSQKAMMDNNLSRHDNTCKPTIEHKEPDLARRQSANET